MMRFVLLEGIHALAEQQLKAQGWTAESGPSRPDWTQWDKVHGLCVRSGTRVTQDVLQALSPDLRVIGAFCIGTDQIDLKQACGMGIPVFNAPYGNTRSVAELTIGHIIALSRRSYVLNDMMHQGKWHKSARGSREVRGKTLGIVGYGHIGSQVGILAESLGMKVLYFDIIEVLPLGNAQSVRNLKELLSLSDIVTLHIPDTPLTRNMIQRDQLQKMKKGSALINTSRGPVINLSDLKQALSEGLLKGAALDVFPKEPAASPSAFVNELQGMKQVILTPHIAGSTEEAQKNIASQVSSALIKYLLHGASEGAVNFPVLNPPAWEPSYHRLVNIHQNVPGVLACINGLVSELKANIKTQQLATNQQIGYLIMDVEKKHTENLCRAINALETSIRTYILPAIGS